MKPKEITISASADLVARLNGMWATQDKGMLNEVFPINLIGIGGSRPVFASEEEVSYLKSLGGYKSPDNYRIYIGSDITQPTEREGGIELPARVLDNRTEFREQVIQRIRNVVGSPQDN